MKNYLTKLTLAVIGIMVLPLTVFCQQPTGDPVNVAKNIDTSVIGEPLNHLVNTPYKELGPMPTKDGKRLYFSRQGHPENTGGANDEDIWYCEFDDAAQSWANAINIGSPLNNEGPNFVTGIGIAGDTLLLGNEYGKRGKMKAGVSISVKLGNLWSFPVPVKVADDYNFAGRASYDLSHDRTALIIAQEKVDSYGKLDLYVSFRDPDAKYPYSGKASINLGDVINTFGNETSPWLAYDGKTLYFSSDGHNGYGGLDIFMTKRLDNTWTSWSEPVNLGLGINSPYDDMSFNYNPGNRYAYYARGLTPTNTDIYVLDMTYLFKDFDRSLADLKEGEVLVEIGETEIVHNVFNDDASEIKPEAIDGLTYVIEYLKKYPEMLIMVSTHSNRHETRNQSLLLSNQRAIKVVDYLVKNGINRNRLSFQGYGHDIVVNSKGNSKSPGTNVASMVEFKLVGLSKGGG